MKGIVRGINVSTGRFFVECGDGLYAAFQAPTGVLLPRGGEFVHWRDGNSPVRRLVGDTSGTIVVSAAWLSIPRDTAMTLLQAV